MGISRSTTYEVDLNEAGTLRDLRLAIEELEDSVAVSYREKVTRVDMVFNSHRGTLRVTCRLEDDE